MRLAAPTADASLAALRRRIDALADPDGRFRVVCAAAGVCPVPVDGLRFPDRATAAVAARLATAYRTRLRERDERTPVYELVVNEGPAPSVVPPDRISDASFDADIVDRDASPTT